MTHQILIVGPAGIGKSKLRQALVEYKNKDCLYEYKYKEDYQETAGAELGIINNRHQILDIGAKSDIHLFFYKHARTVLYCQDINDLQQMNEKNNLKEIQIELEKLKNNLPRDAKVILVGTKRDAWDGDEQQFKSIVESIEEKTNYKFENSILTSSKEGVGIEPLRELFNELAIEQDKVENSILTSSKEVIGIEPLRDLFNALAIEQDEVDNSLTSTVVLDNLAPVEQVNVEKKNKLEQACQLTIGQPIGQDLKKLKKVIRCLPQDKKLAIEKEAYELTKALCEKSELLGEKAESFLNNCTTILNGNHPYILKTAVAVVVTLAVTLVAGIIGFGLGFAAGAWSGPGAFLTGLLSGVSTAAIAATAVSGTLGLTAGAYTFFRDSAEIKAVKGVYQRTQEQVEVNSFFYSNLEFIKLMRNA